MIATSKAEALEAGALILREGGSAVDAALAVALDQCTLTGGSWNSFAGIMTLIHYRAQTGEISALSAGYTSFGEELDPSSIPASAPSGRTALVPAFFDGVLQAHERFGHLPLSRVAAPAITHAEEGFIVDPIFEATVTAAGDVLQRLPETRAIFRRRDGEPYRAGDRLRQPQLAQTLRRFVAEGRGFVYEGEWARHFVEIVRREGGQVTAADLAGYHATWTPLIRVSYRGAEIVLPGEPNRGGSTVAEAFVLADAARLAERGRWDRSGDALYWLARVNQVSYLSGYLPLYAPAIAEALESALVDLGWSLEARLDPARARRMIEAIESGRWDQAVISAAQTSTLPTGHSDAIVVVDPAGNIAALTHTINSVNWGTTGISVDGVTIPDSALVNAAALVTLGAGQRLPDPLNPLIALREGVPVLAASTVGHPHYAQLQRSHAVLALEASPEDAIRMPPLSGAPYAESVPPGRINGQTLAEVAARGMTIREAQDELGLAWIGAARRDRDAPWEGAVEPYTTSVGGGLRLISPD
ncbi:MAG: gamma-glutamyltransferase [Deltaproteobacteria bacterium]|nr:gamma-glutamyltransferase [Deltaproteobacteria bacterium]